MNVWGLDPGTTQSALVVLDGSRIVAHFLLSNDVILAKLRALARVDDVLVIEQIAGMGMAVGAEVFETCFWSGRFAEAWSGASFDRIKRLPIKIHLCGSARAKDANVRQALIDRFGGSAAIGRKSTPGPLYGLRGDEWSALAVAVTWWDTIRCPSPAHAAGSQS